MNVKRILAMGLSLSLLASPAFGQTPPSSAPRHSTHSADEKFVMEGIQGDISEVKMGRLAQEKGQSAAVKQFGEMLEEDHGEHLKKMQSLAQQLGVTSPAEPGAKQKAAYDKIDRAAASSFDKMFAQAMIADHKEDIAKYREQAKRSGPAGDLARETVPTLENHLHHAEALVGKKTAS